MNQFGTCDDDVAHRISVGWMKWRENSGIFCDRKMPLKLKGRLYSVAVRPSITYASQSWTMYENFNSKLTAAEMKMLRISAGVTKLDMIRSTKIRGSLHINQSIAEKLQKDRISWWEHVKRRPPDNPVKEAMEFEILATAKRRGRPKNTWVKQMQHLELVTQGSSRVTRSTAARLVTSLSANPAGHRSGSRRENNDFYYRLLFFMVE